MTDDDNISKLVIFTLGIAGLAFIGFVSYLIYREHKDSMYRLQQTPPQIQQQTQASPKQLSLANDEMFQLDRRLHNLETTKQIDIVSTIEEPKSLDTPRKIVTMNREPIVQSLSMEDAKNIRKLSAADQHRLIRTQFQML